MKITKFLVLSFFLLAFTTSSSPEDIQAQDPEAVIDIFGNELVAGGSYFIRAFPAGSKTPLAVSSVGMDRYIVTTGGMGPLKQFKITKDRANDGLYQLSYYPTSEAFNKRLRVDVGYLANNDEVTYLTPNANPVRFAFVPYLVEVPKIEYKKVSGLQQDKDLSLNSISTKKDDGEEDGAVEVEVDCDGAADVEVLLDDLSPTLTDRMYSKIIAKVRC
ncbi:unnamed protein product [Dovyalis caffra]|uniref:Uncharacterized protein n=1 Tax=Dovyalis caffra TaxID=77055 RepID=A0AAV1SIA2_9ROSI|nr:unnamed protein product [Dovyalis caffra]